MLIGTEQLYCEFLYKQTWNACIGKQEVPKIQKKIGIK